LLFWLRGVFLPVDTSPFFTSNDYKHNSAIPFYIDAIETNCQLKKLMFGIVQEQQSHTLVIPAFESFTISFPNFIHWYLYAF